MSTDRHRQLGFACETCGQMVELSFAVLDRGGKQRHLRDGRFFAEEHGR